VNIPDRVDLELGAALEQWCDQRVIDYSDLEGLLMLHIYGQSVFSQNGLKLTGISFRWKQDSWLLTVKVRENGIPLVGFITAQTTTACVSRLWTLLLGDRLHWAKDKFP